MHMKRRKQDKKKELLHFSESGRHVAEDGVFSNGLLFVSLWKGIGYVFRLFPFCASLGEPSRSLPARGAGAETGSSGTPNLGTQGRQNQKFMWCWVGRAAGVER